MSAKSTARSLRSCVSILLASVFTLGLGSRAILARLSTPVPITISSISPSSVVPLTLITITGTGFNPTLETSVVFSTGTQRQKIRAVQVDSTSVQVSAPILLPGKLNVQVVENPTSGLAVRSNVLKKALTVGSLPVSTASPGEVTLSFLEGQLSQLQQLQTAIAGGPIDTAAVDTKIVNQIAGLEAFISNITDVMSHKQSGFILGQFHGTRVYGSLKSLRRSDRLILAILNAQAMGNQSPLSVSSAASFPTAGDSLAQRAADYQRVFTSDSSEIERSIAAQEYFSIDNISVGSLQNAINITTGAVLAFAAADIFLAGAPALLTVIAAGEVIGEISSVGQVATSVMALFGVPESKQALCEQIVTLGGDEAASVIINVLVGRVWKSAESVVGLVSAVKDLLVEPEKNCPTATPTETPTQTPTETPTETPSAPIAQASPNPVNLGTVVPQVFSGSAIESICNVGGGVLVMTDAIRSSGNFICPNCGEGIPNGGGGSCPTNGDGSLPCSIPGGTCFVWSDSVMWVTPYQLNPNLGPSSLLPPGSYDLSRQWTYTFSNAPDLVVTEIATGICSVSTGC
jgi:hypothetical protein